MSEDLKTLGSEAGEDVQGIAVELVAQLVRTFRVAAVHSLDNEAARQAATDLTERVNRDLEVLRSIRVQVMDSGVYLNNQFVKLKGAAFEAGEQLEQLFDRLGINELSFAADLAEPDTRHLLARFQDHVLGPAPGAFSTSFSHPKIGVRSKRRSHAVSVDRKTELARTFAQLIVLCSEAFETLRARRPFAVVRLRRAVQQLVEAAAEQEALLVALALHPHDEPDAATHAAGTGALTLLMGQRLKASKRSLVELVLCALFHDLGPGETPRRAALRTVLSIAGVTRSADALDRVAVALEVRRPAAADFGELEPGVSARLVAVASTFLRLTQPPGDGSGVSPGQAVRLLLDDAGVHFDRRAVKLFTSMVGVYPPGSLVRLSGGQLAVVLSTPAGQPASRPTVRVIEDRGEPADYIVELSGEDASVEVVEGLPARAHPSNLTHFLLA